MSLVGRTPMPPSVIGWFFPWRIGRIWKNLEKHMAATSYPGSFVPAALGFSAIHGAAQTRSGAEPWFSWKMGWSENDTLW